MARRKKKGGGGEGGAGWLVTYSDLMTLLLCFFVLLYGMSTTDEAKMQQLAESLQQAFSGSIGFDILDQMNKDEGDDAYEEDAIEGDGVTVEELEALEESFDIEYSDELMGGYAEEIHEAVDEYLKDHELNSEVNVEVVEEGVLLDIKDHVFFDLGKSQIKTESLAMLDKLSGLFKNFSSGITIVGHTDSIPINTTQYPSNWELAAARSCAIARYYITQGFAPTRFTCSSAGETKPIASNETEDGRAKNRRVNFLIEATLEELQQFMETY